MKVPDYISGLVPYQPGKPIAETQREFQLSQVVKLASNENALGPSPQVLKAVAQEARNIHIYPDASCHDLGIRVSDYYGLSPRHLLFGNGSNELIDLLIRTFCQPGDQIITTQRAFLAYKICAQAAGVSTKEIPLREDFGFDLKALTRYCRQLNPREKIIFIPNPNNPTGTYSNVDEVQELVEVVGGRDDLLLVFDEAYFEFVTANDFPQSFDLATRYKNIMVLRTYSKVFALAGLRLGFIYGDPELLSVIHRIRNPFNVNHLAQVAAIAAMDDVEHLRKSQKLVWSGLEYFYKELARLKLDTIPSQGNFVLFNAKRDAATIYRQLLMAGVIMRPVANYGLPTYLRLSVGRQEDNILALETLERVLAHLEEGVESL